VYQSIADGKKIKGKAEMNAILIFPTSLFTIPYIISPEKAWTIALNGIKTHGLETVK
jgi:hypothetical protein